MKNMKVSKKLIVSFVIVIVLAAVIGVVGIFSLTSAADNTALMADRTEIAIIAARMNRTVQAQRAAFRGAAVYHVMGMIDQRDANLADLETLEAEYDSLHEQVAPMLQTETGLALMADIDSALTPFAAARDAFIEGIVDPNVTDESMVAQLDTVAATVAPLASSIAALVDFADTLTTDMAIEAEATSQRTTIILIAVMAGAVVAGFALAFYISGLISKPINAMAGYIRQAGETGNLQFKDEEWANCDRISQGKDEIGQTMKAFTQMMRKFVYYGGAVNRVAQQDLTFEVETLGEVDTFGNAIKQMTVNLNQMFTEINNSTVQVSTGAKQVADGAQALAQGATEQAASIEEISSSITEMADKVRENAEMANKASTLADTIKTDAEKGNRQMDEMMTAVKDINDASQSISKIIKTIDDIAFQTNILALNAAVEAARAGQHGKGFAVVAEEVRNLAAKSAEAAKDTDDMIQNSMEKSERGAKIAEETAASLVQIVAGINESGVIVAEIAQSSEEQSAGISQINLGVDQVAQVVQQNSATAQESAAASQEMSSQSTMLQELIAQFKLKSSAQGFGHVSPAADKVTYSAPVGSGMEEAVGGMDDKY